MEKSIEELKKEGEAIAKKLGNGVTYVAPWFKGNEKKVFMGHTFNDDRALTGTTFVAQDFEEAKRKLIELRKQFGMAPPNF